MRADATTRRALELVLEAAKGAGAEVDLVDLAHLSLPLFDESDETPSAAVVELRSRVRRAHGIVLATPEYHGSYSGALKNALDSLGDDEVATKIVGLVGVAGGGSGASHALDHLRNVAKTLHAWVAPIEVSVARSRKAFDASGKPADPAVAARLAALGEMVVRFAKIHRDAGALEILPDGA